MAQTVGWRARALAGAAFAACIVGGIAATVQDRFNGASFNPMWHTAWTDEAAMTLANGKVSWSSDSDFDAGILINQNYALNCNKPWSMSFDYALNQGTIPEGGYSGLGIALDWLGVSTLGLQGKGGSSAALSLFRSSQGTFIGTYQVLYAGASIPVAEKAIPAQGTFVMAYNAKKDRLTCYVNNRVVFTVRRYTEQFGISDPIGIAIEGSTGYGSVPGADSNPPIVFTNGMTVDNFRATGKGVILTPTVE